MVKEVDIFLNRQVCDAAGQSASTATPYTSVDIGNGRTEVYTKHTVIDRFKRGVVWQRNHVWHDASEVPVVEGVAKYFAVIFENRLTSIFMTVLLKNQTWNDISASPESHKVVKWANVEDLLPVEL